MELLLLIIAVVFAAVVGAAAVALGSEYRRVHSAGAGGQAGHQGGGLGTYELAYLSGGPRRVINTALALLVRAGSVRLSRGGWTSLVSGAPQPSEPIEHAVLDALGSRGGSCQVEAVRRTVADGRAMSGLRHRLLGMGLLVPDGAFTEARRLHNRLLVVTLLTIVFELGAVLAGGSWGTARWAAVLVAGVASIGGLITYLGRKRALRGVVTRAGHEALTSVRGIHLRGVRPAEAGLVLAVGIPVALYGLSELGDPVLEEELNRQAQSQGAAGGSGCAGGACGGSTGSSDGVFYGGDFGGDSGGGWGGGDSGGDSGGGSSCGGGSGCGSGCGGG